jgi:pilus assembly protein CpaB
MNNKAFTMSIALAALAVFMIYNYIASKEAELKGRYGTPTAVVIAKTNISELAEIHENMVEIISKPKQFLEPGKTTSKQEVVGFIATVPIRKGEQITLNKIIAPGVKTGLSKQITPGKRAVSIPVDDNNAVTRLIKPGDRIDLMATIEPPGGVKGSQITKMVLQDLPVLAVGEYITTQAPRKVEKDETTGKDNVRNLNVERNFNTITVEVDPQSAMQVSLLKDAPGARLGVMLRNNDDTERVNMSAVTLMDVLGADSNKIIRNPASR